MYYETQNFEEIIQIMASCERLGLLYVVQRDVLKKRKRIGFGGKEKVEPVWKLQVIQYVEEVEQSGEEEENIQRRQSEGSEADGETEGGNDLH
jgi:hypothetical protein